MLNVNAIEENYDEMEKVVDRYSFEELFERFNGYNLMNWEDDDKREFDLEYNNCIYTIRKVPYLDYCVLSNSFQVFYNNEWLEFERW